MCRATCPYCYAESSEHGVNYPDALGHVQEHYGSLPPNLRPFQVAIGGGGEPTLHPDFPAILKEFRSLGIIPNYTTNGMHLTPDVIQATSDYAGGVAISCHEHLEPCWSVALDKLHGRVPVSLHIIVGLPGSSDRFWNIWATSLNADTVVALPYVAIGRAETVQKAAEWDEFFCRAVSKHPSNVAFGAGFYEFFRDNPIIAQELDVDIYEPEVLSGYRIMDDSFRLLRKSSYDHRPKFESC
jgi:organic radical activating enzyme